MIPMTNDIGNLKKQEEIGSMLYVLSSYLGCTPISRNEHLQSYMLYNIYILTYTTHIYIFMLTKGIGNLIRYGKHSKNDMFVIYFYSSSQK